LKDKGPPTQPEPPQEEPEPGQPAGSKRDPVDDLLADIASMSTHAGITEMEIQLNARLKNWGITVNEEISKILLKYFDCEEFSIVEDQSFDAEITLGKNFPKKY